MNQNVEEIRERCKANTENEARKGVCEEEESMLWKIVKYLKTLERAEAKKGSEESQEVVELEVEVKEEEEVEWRSEDPEQVRQGREEEVEMNHMVKTLRMFEFWFVGRCDVESGQGSYHDEVDSSSVDAQFQTKTRGSEGRLVLGVATAGGKVVCIRCSGA